MKHAGLADGFAEARWRWLTHSRSRSRRSGSPNSSNPPAGSDAQTAPLRIHVAGIPQDVPQRLAVELDDIDVTALAALDGSDIVITPAQPIAFGKHTLRLVEYTPDGGIAERGRVGVRDPPERRVPAVAAAGERHADRDPERDGPQRGHQRRAAAGHRLGADTGQGGERILAGERHHEPGRQQPDRPDSAAGKPPRHRAVPAVGAKRARRRERRRPPRARAGQPGDAELRAPRRDGGSRGRQRRARHGFFDERDAARRLAQPQRHERRSQPHRRHGRDPVPARWPPRRARRQRHLRRRREQRRERRGRGGAAASPTAAAREAWSPTRSCSTSCCGCAARSRAAATISTAPAAGSSPSPATPIRGWRTTRPGAASTFSANPWCGASGRRRRC